MVKRDYTHAVMLIILAIICCACSERPSDARIALFNVKELSTKKLMQVDEKGKGQHEQLRAVAKIIARINPDILILNEIDHDYSPSAADDLSRNLSRFIQNYLLFESADLNYPHLFAAPCNTGIRTGFDLNNDNITATAEHEGSRVHGDDCFGWGQYPGQYSMGVLSRFPLEQSGLRMFQKFLWKDLPGNHMPDDYYAAEVVEIFRLSSKSHWDLPVRIGDTRLHLLLSHPTPPVFDGPEDRNGRRNFDEIMFWQLYLDGSDQLYDDTGKKGGFNADALFLIAGDLNAAPGADTVYNGVAAIDQLLGHQRILETGTYLQSTGGVEGRTPGAPRYYEQSTASFGRGYRTRIDYLLPDKRIKVNAGGVFWPDSASNPDGNLLAETASDHRLVWLDISF